MIVISEKVKEDLERELKINQEKDKKSFIVFCYDLPSEYLDSISDEDKRLVFLKRILFKNYIDKFSIFVSNSVYMCKEENFEKLLEEFDNQYSEIDEKGIKVKLDILGVAFNLELVKEKILAYVEKIEKESKNFFELVLDTDKVKDKKEIDKMNRNYKRLVRKLGIAINYRCSDLEILDKSLAIGKKEKLQNFYNNKYDVRRKINNLENDLRFRTPSKK
jgi:hypothetical protein